MSPRRKSLPTQPEDQNTGSPRSGEPVFLVAGRFRRPHGVRGEIILEVLTDFPERLKPGTLIYVGDEHRPVRIMDVRTHDQLLLLTLEGYNTRETSSELTNNLVYVRSDQLPDLPEGNFYHHQLLGMKVLDEGGTMLGKLVEILETGANDVYVVQPEAGEEILVPAIESVVLRVDLGNGEIHVRLPEWT